MLCGDAKRVFGVRVGLLERVAGTRCATERATPVSLAAEGDCLPGGVAVGDDSLGGMLAGVEPGDVSYPAAG